MKKHKRSKGGTYYTYHLYLAHAEEKSFVQIPYEVKVDSNTFNQAQPNLNFLQMYIREGWLQIPWFEKIQITNNKTNP